jgi:hypothetical protein
MTFPKVLVCAPTAKAKNYCFKDWLDNSLYFKYPNYYIRVFDNTQDGGKNANYLNSIYQNLYGGDKFKAYHSKTDKINSVIERMAFSHNLCKKEAILGGYDYILHLETDIFPPADVIENLMYYKRQVIGALYDRDEGRYRTLMAQKHILASPYNIQSVNFVSGDEIPFMDGTVKAVSSVGLGCVLIEKSVFKKINFRFVKGEQNHPDSYFCEDCFRNNIKIFADTSILCRHDNTAWGIYGIDFK